MYIEFHGERNRGGNLKYFMERKGKRERGGREGERERERVGSPIEVSSHEIMDLLLGLGVKILKLVHSTAR